MIIFRQLLILNMPELPRDKVMNHSNILEKGEEGNIYKKKNVLVSQQLSWPAIPLELICMQGRKFLSFHSDVFFPPIMLLASLMAQMVKNPPAIWETWVQSLCWEGPLEKGTATHSIILAQRITQIKEPGRLQSIGSQRVGDD